MAKWMMPEAMKQAQWEICKGQLRALAAMQGSYEMNEPGSEAKEARASKLFDAIEKFIEDVEIEGLHE